MKVILVSMELVRDTSHFVVLFEILLKMGKFK